MSTLRSDRLKKRDTLIRAAATAYYEYAEMMKMHQSIRKDERRRAGTLRKAAPASDSRVNLTSRLGTGTRPLEPAPSKRVDLAKALRPRLHEPQTVDLVKALHRTGGQPLVKFVAGAMTKTAPAAAPAPAPAVEVEFVEETNQAALHALEARVEREERDACLASMRQALASPGTLITPGAKTWT